MTAGTRKWGISGNEIGLAILLNLHAQRKVRLLTSRGFINAKNAVQS